MVTYGLELSKTEAAMLLELLSKAAVIGTSARVLAGLYDKAVAAVEYFSKESTL